MKFQEWLDRANACQAGIDWVNGRSVKRAFRECHRGDWMLWLAEQHQKKLGITDVQLWLIACACAERVLRLIDDADIPRKVIRARRAWLQGATSAEEMFAAALVAMPHHQSLAIMPVYVADAATATVIVHAKDSAVTPYVTKNAAMAAIRAAHKAVGAVATSCRFTATSRAAVLEERFEQAEIVRNHIKEDQLPKVLSERMDDVRDTDQSD